MGHGFGLALRTLGAGLSGMASDMEQRRAVEAERDARLAMGGYFRRAPKTPMEAGTGMMEAVGPSPVANRVGEPDAMMSAVLEGGAGRSLVPGMRPRPMSATLGMDVDFGDVGPGDPRAYAPDAQPAPARPSMVDLQEAVRSAKAFQAPDTMEMFGQSYEYRPEATPEGRRAALQDAVRQRGNREAYRSLAGSFDGLGEFNPGVDYTQMLQSAGTSALRARERQVDPDQNRAAYDSVPADAFPGGRKPPFVDGDDWTKVRQRYLNGELGQRNTIETRVMFPPQSGGGGDGLTPTQERTRAVQGARGRAQLLARQGVPEAAIIEHLNYWYADKVEPDVLAGLVTVAMRTSAPKPSGSGGGESPWAKYR